MSTERTDRLDKEAVDARFTALQEANRARRQHKVTADDMRRRLDERGATRKAGRGARTLSLCLGVGLLLGAGGVAVGANAARHAADEEARLLAQQIAAAEGDLRAIPTAQQDAASVYADEVQTALAIAAQKAREVAELQQEFTAIYFAGNEESAQNGGASESNVKAGAHRKKLAPYFLEEGFLVDGAAAYAPLSIEPYDLDQIDPRFPWFVGFDDGKVADPTRDVWRLASVMPSRSDGIFETVWLNENLMTGDLNAWASASYYVQDESFTRLRVGMTTVGSQTATQLQETGE